MQFEGACRFIEGGAAGHHVVDEQDVGSGDVGPAVKCLADITASGVRWLIGLGGGVALAFEQVGLRGNGEPASDRASQFKRLIEAALTQTGGVQGHREQNVYRAARRCGGGQRLAEPVGQCQAMPVFVSLQ